MESLVCVRLVKRWAIGLVAVVAVGAALVLSAVGSSMASASADIYRDPLRSCFAREVHLKSWDQVGYTWVVVKGDIALSTDTQYFRFYYTEKAKYYAGLPLEQWNATPLRNAEDVDKKGFYTQRIDGLTPKEIYVVRLAGIKANGENECVGNATNIEARPFWDDSP